MPYVEPMTPFYDVVAIIMLGCVLVACAVASYRTIKWIHSVLKPSARLPLTIKHATYYAIDDNCNWYCYDGKHWIKRE